MFFLLFHFICKTFCGGLFCFVILNFVRLLFLFCKGLAEVYNILFIYSITAYPKLALRWCLGLFPWRSKLGLLLRQPSIPSNQLLLSVGARLCKDRPFMSVDYERSLYFCKWTLKKIISDVDEYFTFCLKRWVHHEKGLPKYIQSK